MFFNSLLFYLFVDLFFAFENIQQHILIHGDNAGVHFGNLSSKTVLQSLLLSLLLVEINRFHLFFNLLTQIEDIEHVGSIDTFLNLCVVAGYLLLQLVQLLDVPT